ncbi:MAG: hypothetical protein RIQ54_557 [Candidatus Parcubacteria bacterium]
MDQNTPGLIILVVGLALLLLFAWQIVKIMNAPCGEEIQKPGHRTSEDLSQPNGSFDDPQFNVKTMYEEVPK